jgi:nitrogen fixation NifU-like protein
MEDFYRELIIERYKSPHFRGKLDPNDISYEDDNPACGDHIQIDVRIDETQTVTEAKFSGEGCAISQASADLLLESIIGKNLEDLKDLAKEDILEMLGIELGPVRLKCALLPLKVLKAGVYGIGESED